jgi:MoaA/NifB/PqqE/SkfB family radical SAM enzyme
VSKEWDSKWNSFNSNKGLLYKQHYDAILAGKFLPPIEVNLDPVNSCNLNCFWCNNKETKSRNVFIGKDHLIKLVRFFKDWGVKALCIAGGGEPTLHEDLADVFWLAKAIDLPISILTNGRFKYENQLKAVAECSRWIGVSVDSAKPETYKKIKGKDQFRLVIENMKRLVKLGAREVMYKFLLHPINQKEVYYAIKLAKDIGCHGIHIRPISFMNFQDKEEEYDLEGIDFQVERGRRRHETSSFKVFNIKHKYDRNLHRKFMFKRCLASPLMAIFEANGDIMLCIDRKNDQDLVIGKHFEIDRIKEVWGGERHKTIINSINLKECPKCTFNAYNEIMQEAIINNKCDWEFT